MHAVGSSAAGNLSQLPVLAATRLSARSQTESRRSTGGASSGRLRNTVNVSGCRDASTPPRHAACKRPRPVRVHYPFIRHPLPRILSPQYQSCSRHRTVYTSIGRPRPIAHRSPSAFNRTRRCRKRRRRALPRRSTAS
jgi:hypothetical protein